MQPDQQPPQDDLHLIVERLRNSNNVLVTISTNPTVDQFAACIGLTLVLNKMGKHANAVFSGAVPSTIDFLQPEKTIEKNTDSLRDFIIALDKSKADKLRYKVEDSVVKIFITPYRTSISDKDLDYSQGDFNVDSLIALGVHNKDQLDSAILAHGRILHDAVVMSINTTAGNQLGSINWVDSQVSSLCEMVADIARELSKDIFDNQNSTALLTGIVAETDRYSNEKATPHTMSIAGILMAAGASTQLVSTKLSAQKEEVLPPIIDRPSENPEGHDGVIEINHAKDEELMEQTQEQPAEEKLKSPYEEEHEIFGSPIHIDEHGELKKLEDDQQPDSPKNRIVSEPPKLGGELTANTVSSEGKYLVSTDPLSNNSNSSILKREDSNITPFDPLMPEGQTIQAPHQPSTTLTHSDQTLSDLEKSIGSPHAAEVPETSLDNARDAVVRATGSYAPKAREDQGTTSFEDQAPLDQDADSGEPKSPPPQVPPPFVPES